MATAIISSNIEGSSSILVSSVYWDGRIDSFPEKATEAIIFGREKDYPLIIGGDMNARNTLFGSNTTDKRGRILEDLMIEYDLEVANKGTKPTCMASHPGSIIDVTFVCGEKSSIISEWRVTKDETFSDHNLIRFRAEGPKPEVQTRRKMNDVQKQSFTRATREIAHRIGDKYKGGKITVDSIEALSTELINSLIDAKLKNSTTYHVKIKEAINLWFDKDLREEKKKHRTLKHLYTNSGNDPAKRVAWKKQEQRLTTLYQKARKEKKEGNSCKITTQEDIAKLNKYAKSGPRREVALIKNPEGIMASSPTEALKNLCDAHFPGSKVINSEDINREIHRANQRIPGKDRENHSWINLERIKKALESFGNRKARNSEID